MDHPWDHDLAQLLPDAVVVLGPAGALRWANAAAERIFGTTFEDGT